MIITQNGEAKMVVQDIESFERTRDLEEIDDYICTSDSPQKADYVLQKIENVFQSLVESPKRPFN
jgi:plasmid stabilization system protein ParE